MAAKATKMIKQVLNYQPHYSAWFAANQDLFNRVATFYFEVIAAHEKVLDLSNKEALTTLEKLTHATKKNPTPVMPLAEVAEDVPAMFRRAAMQGHADRNASLVIGQRLIARYQKLFQEKPPTPLATEKVVKATGVEVCQEAKSKRRPSTDCARHADSNEHGTAHETDTGMGASVSGIPRQLRLFNE